MDTELLHRSMPLCETLRMRVQSASPELVELALDWSPSLCTSAGLLHGGAVMALADSAGGACAFLNLPEGAGTSTIESKTNFLGAVKDGTIDIRAVVHAHPPTATGFAVANVSLDAPFLPEVVIRTGGTPVVPYTIPGGDELPMSLVPYLKDHVALLLGNHGAVAFAPTLREAMWHMETIELNARIYLTAHQLGNIRFLDENEVEALQERYIGE